MPRQTRKTRLLSPHKSHLRFVEQPRNGPKHDYGQQLRSAINPRSFVSDETQRQSSSVSSWVSPQFTNQKDTTIRRGGRRRRNHLPSDTMNTTSILPLHQGRRSNACKYSSLSFKTSISVSQRHPSAVHKKASSCAGKLPKKQDEQTVPSANQTEVPKMTPRQTDSLTTRGQKTATSDPTLSPRTSHTEECVKTPLGLVLGKQGTVRSFHTPTMEGNDTSSAFTPPHMETPEIPHNVKCCSSLSIFLPFFSNEPGTPPNTLNASVLVKDTPERDYGLKVTWRRRKKLMKLLSDRGQLLFNEATISKTGF